MLYYFWRHFNSCIIYNCRTAIDEAKVISYLGPRGTDRQTDTISESYHVKTCRDTKNESSKLGVRCRSQYASPDDGDAYNYSKRNCNPCYFYSLIRVFLFHSPFVWPMYLYLLCFSSKFDSNNRMLFSHMVGLSHITKNSHTVIHSHITKDSISGFDC